MINRALLKNSIIASLALSSVSLSSNNNYKNLQLNWPNLTAQLQSQQDQDTPTQYKTFNHLESLVLLKSYEQSNEVENANRITIFVSSNDMKKLQYHLEVIKRTLKHKDYEILVLSLDKNNNNESKLLNCNIYP